MDKLVCPTSSGTHSSPASLFSVAGGSGSVLKFVSCEISDQWLGADDDGLDKPWDVAAGTHLAGHDLSVSSEMAPAAPAKRRGRKPGSRNADGPAMNHVEAERQRRDKLNRRFCDLRAAVPKVTRMDKASLLADAASYIVELRGRVGKLEADAKQASAAAAATTAAASPSGLEEKLEVRMVGREAAARHAPASLMDALRSLDLTVQHACVCRAGEVTVQDAVVDVPAGPLQDEAWLRAVLLHRLQGSGCPSF